MSDVLQPRATHETEEAPVRQAAPWRYALPYRYTHTPDAYHQGLLLEQLRARWRYHADDVRLIGWLHAHRWAIARYVLYAYLAATLAGRWL